MKVIKTPQEMREWSQNQKKTGKTIGFVPTMGALHEGHLSLVKQARAENTLSVVSIFVNPIQFGPNEDFNRYPRPIETDSGMLKNEGVDVLYNPDPETMYPKDYDTYIELEKLPAHLCGLFRPGHFRGVATVVARLFNLVLPNRAYFGLKDYQQFRVINRMVQDLCMGVDVVGCPIVRESDGLAMSSRNRYLSAEERVKALSLSKALYEARRLYKDGETDAALLCKVMRDTILLIAPEAEIQYAEAVDGMTLETIEKAGPGTLLAIALILGKTRLIDNLVLE